MHVGQQFLSFLNPVARLDWQVGAHLRVCRHPTTGELFRKKGTRYESAPQSILDHNKLRGSHLDSSSFIIEDKYVIITIEQLSRQLCSLFLCKMSVPSAGRGILCDRWFDVLWGTVFRNSIDLVPVEVESSLLVRIWMWGGFSTKIPALRGLEVYQEYWIIFV